MNFRVALLLGQIYVHIGFFYGIYHFRSWDLVAIVVLNQIVFVGFCGTSFYHRIVAHRHPIHPVFEKLMLLLSWLGVSGSAIAWAGTHRLHHRTSDTEKDPHSPIHRGRLRTYWLSSGDEGAVRYVTDLLRKPLYLFQHQYYFRGLILTHLVIGIFLPLKVYWAILICPAFLMWFAGSTINVFCHDQSGPVNHWVWGLLHGGEGFHKNHHENAQSPAFHRWADWGYICFRIMNIKAR
jgi:sn-1 stearoyl-lipid 9-desaturase